jgi:hypothetical protein
MLLDHPMMIVVLLEQCFQIVLTICQYYSGPSGQTAKDVDEKKKVEEMDHRVGWHSSRQLIISILH